MSDEDREQQLARVTLGWSSGRELRQYELSDEDRARQTLEAELFALHGYVAHSAVGEGTRFMVDYVRTDMLKRWRPLTHGPPVSFDRFNAAPPPKAIRGSNAAPKWQQFPPAPGSIEAKLKRGALTLFVLPGVGLLIWGAFHGPDWPLIVLGLAVALGSGWLQTIWFPETPQGRLTDGHDSTTLLIGKLFVVFAAVFAGFILVSSVTVQAPTRPISVTRPAPTQSSALSEALDPSPRPTEVTDDPVSAVSDSPPTSPEAELEPEPEPEPAFGFVDTSISELLRVAETHGMECDPPDELGLDCSSEQIVLSVYASDGDVTQVFAAGSGSASSILEYYLDLLLLLGGDGRQAASWLDQVRTREIAERSFGSHHFVYRGPMDLSDLTIAAKE